MSTLVDADHTWTFQTPSQLTAPNYVYESIGFSGLVQMDFSEPMTAGDSLASITSATVTDIAANTEPTVSTTALSSDKTGAVLTLATAGASANTYTFTVTVSTTNGETIVRKAKLVLS
jgi:hypothetical protein